MECKRESDYTGLTAAEAEHRLTKYGRNTLEQHKKKSPVLLFLGQFKDIMTIILIVCTGISAFMQDWTEAAVMIGIVVVNAFLGFIQEYRTEKTIEALRSMTALHARVLRDGRQIEISAEEIVPGDVVFVKGGDILPADGFIITSSGLTVDEAMLTGESAAVEKSELAGFDSAVYSGTLAISGSATVGVTDTGMNTKMGKISGMIQEVKEESTPLQKRLAKLGKYIVFACVLICAAVTLAGILRGEDIINMLLTGISLAVAAVPEGLPAIVTISLALGVQRMAANNALVRRLPAVETLGGTNVICSDKTGTLTQNKMSVREIRVPSEMLGGRADSASRAGDLRMLSNICRVCNNLSDATEQALKEIGGQEAEASAAEFVRIAEIPFDSIRKCMSVIVKNKQGEFFVMTKGGADVVLGKAGRYIENGGIRRLDPAALERFRSCNDRLASGALRVLAAAYRPIRPDEAEEYRSSKDKTKQARLESNLIFAGFIGLMDRPREEVPGAVQLCADAGIRTIMITGDHKITAAAIAREVNIPASRVLTGEEISRMNDAEFEEAVDSVNVYARVLPEHKLRIVRALRKKNNTVAMTGDGVNDAPAIKEADIGIAMGVNGTDVTREASDMVLMDDNFATIAEAVKQGRGIYDNIRKFIRYMLACNLGEVITMFAGVLFGLPLPLYPIQILWVNLVTDGLPGIALGLDPVTDEIMKRKPVPANRGLFYGRLPFLILFRGLLIGLCTLGAFVSIQYATGNTELARTAAFMTLVMTQIVHSFECRSETKSLLQSGIRDNLWLLAAGALSMLMMLAVIYIPSLQSVFRTVPMELEQMAVVAGFTAIGPILGGLANDLLGRNPFSSKVKGKRNAC